MNTDEAIGQAFRRMLVAASRMCSSHEDSVRLYIQYGPPGCKGYVVSTISCEGIHDIEHGQADLAAVFLDSFTSAIGKEAGDGEADQ